jgi:enoyl-[acyl-carrier-protein] reductase (NADH)
MILSPWQGYLAAISASSFSMVSMVQRFAPIMNEGGAVLSLTYLASTSIIPGYGGGMSSAKAVSPVSSSASVETSIFLPHLLQFPKFIFFTES